MCAGSRLLLPVSINFITLVPKPGRKEGHAVREPSLLRGIAVLRRSEEMETAGCCPRRWCWSNGRAGGTEGSLPCSWDEEGWLPSKRERRSRRRSPVGRSLLPSARLVEKQGTGDTLPAALDRRSHRHPPGGGWASGHPPKRSSTITWHREWAAQLVEDRAAVCPGTGPRFFFFEKWKSKSHSFFYLFSIRLYLFIFQNVQFNSNFQRV